MRGDAYDVNKKVTVNFDEVVWLSGIDDFNDYICNAVGEDLLQDIAWEVLGVKDGGIKLQVTGWVDTEGV